MCGAQLPTAESITCFQASLRARCWHLPQSSSATAPGQLSQQQLSLPNPKLSFSLASAWYRGATKVKLECIPQNAAVRRTHLTHCSGLPQHFLDLDLFPNWSIQVSNKIRLIWFWAGIWIAESGSSWKESVSPLLGGFAGRRRRQLPGSKALLFRKDSWCLLAPFMSGLISFLRGKGDIWASGWRVSGWVLTCQPFLSFLLCWLKDNFSKNWRMVTSLPGFLWRSVLWGHVVKACWDWHKHCWLWGSAASAVPFIRVWGTAISNDKPGDFVYVPDFVTSWEYPFPGLLCHCCIHRSYLSVWTAVAFAVLSNDVQILFAFLPSEWHSYFVQWRIFLLKTIRSNLI